MSLTSNDQSLWMVTGALLILFAARLLSRSIMFLQFAGDLGIAWNNLYDVTAYRWLTVDTETGKFLGAMLGWDPRPSIERVFAYLGYAITAGYPFLRTPRRVVGQCGAASPVAVSGQ